MPWNGGRDWGAEIHMTNCSPNAINDTILHPSEHLPAHFTTLQSDSRVQGKGWAGALPISTLHWEGQHGLVESWECSQVWTQNSVVIYYLPALGPWQMTYCWACFLNKQGWKQCLLFYKRCKDQVRLRQGLCYSIHSPVSPAPSTTIWHAKDWWSKDTVNVLCKLGRTMQAFDTTITVGII